jgi:CHAT domain-containing protein
MGLINRNLVRRAGRLMAGTALIVSLAVPAFAQMSAGSADQAVVQQAEAQIAERRYGQALDAYLSLLDRTSDPDTALRYALRAAQLGNATGRLQDSYDALKPRLRDVSALDPQLADKGQELLIEATDGLKLKDETISTARRLVSYRKTTQGASSVAAQAAQLTLANLLEKYGSPEEGKALRDAALDVVAKGDTYLYQSILNNTAIVLQNNGRLDSAAEIYARLVASLREGETTPELGITYFNAAVLDRDRRAFDSAIEYHAKAIEVLEETTGRMSAETIAAVGGLGQTYSSAGRTASALPPLRDALSRAEESLGDVDDTMIQANNLADVLRTLGQFKEAEKLDRKAYDWRRVNLGEVQESTLISQRNLALDLFGLNRAKEAAALYRGIVAALEANLGEDHPETVSMRNQSDIIGILTGQSPASPKAFDKLLVGTEPTRENVRMANLLAGIAEKSGDLERENQLTQLALTLSEGYYGRLHPMTLAMLTNVARNASEKKSPDTSRHYLELEERLRLWSRREIASTSDPAVMEDVALKTRETIGDMLSYAMRVSPKDGAGARLFSTILLEWKSVGTMERDILQAASVALSGKDRELLDRVRKLQAESLKAADGKESEDLDRQLAIAEAALADRVSPLRQLHARWTRSYSDVLTSMAEDEAVIDYIIAPIRVSPDKVEDRLLAMLGRNNEDVLFYNLGPASEIDALIPEPDAVAKKKTRKDLYAALIKPMEKQLKGINRINVVPDGLLNLVPFDGLIDTEGKNLIERMDVRVARNGRAIHGEEDKTRGFAPGKMLLVGDVDYGGAANSLPYTGAEIDMIGELAPYATMTASKLRGADAGEEGVRSAVAGNRILHFATHGFFEPMEGAKTSPLWRSGILLAGAKPLGSGEETVDDGIAHAAEIANWQLSGVDLVVLSACDTAQGDRSYVEGLNGLPSALAIAGAKRSLLARWPVPDRATAILMANFYRELAITRSYEDAIRNTKLDIIKGKLEGVPDELWLAFSMIEN